MAKQPGVLEEEEDQTGDSKNPYDPMAGRLTPYLADGGIVDEEQTKQPFIGPPAPLPVAPPRPMPGMGPDVRPDALQQMMGRYKSGMEQYGPEQQMATRAALTKSNAGFLPSLARAGGGFADAVMQGVARAGPSNFQQSITNQQNKTIEDTMGTLERAQGGKMAQMQAEMKLAAEDPSSPLSKIAQQSNAPTLKAMGLSDAEISGMPASLISEATSKRLSLEEIRVKAEEIRALREQTGRYQEETIKTTRAGQAQSAAQKETERQAADKKARLDAAEAILKRSGNARIMGIPIPFTSDVSGKAQKAALKTLEGGMNQSEAALTSVNSPEEYQALPSGTHYVDSNGKRGVKK
jgi:hypothetical protein